MEEKKSSPQSGYLRRLTSLKWNLADKANGERNIKVANLFMQKLAPLIHDKKLPEPGFIGAPTGFIDVVWNRFEESGFVLTCTVDHEDGKPVLQILNVVYGQSDIYETLAFTTEQEQDKAIEAVVNMLKPLAV
jgi:hypothetical protein